MVLGGSTVINNIEFIKRIIQSGNIFEISSAILIPLPKTHCFNMILSHPTLSKKYIKRDLLNIEELQIDWVQNFCNIKYEQLLKALEEVSNITPISSSFGRRI